GRSGERDLHGGPAGRARVARAALGRELEPRERLVVHLEPLVPKAGLEVAHAGASKAEVRLAPLAGAARVALPLLRDADAAGEADLLVADEQLAMRALVVV